MKTEKEARMLNSITDVINVLLCGVPPSNEELEYEPYVGRGTAIEHMHRLRLYK